MVAGTAVLADGNRLDSRAHALPAQRAVQVIDLVGRESGHAVLERGDAPGAVDFLVFDLDTARPGHHAADVEEAQAPFVLLVLLRGLVDDACVQQGDRLALRRASSASVGRSKVRAGVVRIGSPACTMPAACIVSLALDVTSLSELSCFPVGP